MWKLWLDDQLDDPSTPGRHVPPGFLGARSTAEAQELVRTLGPPEWMDLDHDLGKTPTGESDTAMKFLNWLFWEYGCETPPEYSVHSQNPIGRANIISFMESWRRTFENKK